MYSSLIIVTKNRPGVLEKLLLNLGSLNTFFDEILIIDSSEESLILKIDGDLMNKLRVKKINKHASISIARNIGLSQVSSRTDLVYFLDDDVQLHEDFLVNSYMHFQNNADSIGVTGQDLNLTKKFTKNTFIVKIMFLLFPYFQGKVLRTGQHIGHYNKSFLKKIDWMPGCCMIYKYSYIKNLKFDQELDGFSGAEDLVFSQMVSKFGKLYYDPNIKYWHNLSPINRWSKKQMMQLNFNHLKTLRLKNQYSSYTRFIISIRILHVRFRLFIYRLLNIK